MSGELERLGYELGLRSLSHQEDVVRDVRSSTATLLAASALVASFLGGRAFDTSGFGWLTVPALISFLATVLPTAYLLAPKAALRFAIQGADAYEYFAETDRDLTDAYRTLAYWIADARTRNQETIDRMFFWLRVGSAALVLEVVFWSLALAVD